jgi:hypothetical protein
MKREIARFANAANLVFTLQRRSYFPQIYLAMAATTILVLRLTPLRELVEDLVPVLLLGEYGTLGLMLVAAHRFFEQNERSVTALVVTPLRSGEYLIALVVASAVAPTLAGVAMQAFALGFDARLAALAPLLFLTCCLAGLGGYAMSTRFDEFTHFLISVVPPVSTLLLLPLLAHFDYLPRAIFVWLPSDPAFFAFAELASESPSPTRLAFYTAELLAWNAAAFLLARHSFHTRVRSRLETA